MAGALKPLAARKRKSNSDCQSGTPAAGQSRAPGHCCGPLVLVRTVAGGGKNLKLARKFLMARTLPGVSWIPGMRRIPVMEKFSELRWLAETRRFLKAGSFLGTGRFPVVKKFPEVY